MGGVYAFTESNAFDQRSVATGQGSWTVTAGTVGDLRIVSSNTFSGTIGISSLSGGGVTTWTQACVKADSSQGRTVEIWYGVITSTGTALTVNYSGSIGTTTVHQARYDFHFNGVGAYSLVAAGTSFLDTTSATATGPSLTATADGQLYYSHMRLGGPPPTNNSGTGWTMDYTSTTFDTQVWNPNLTAGANSSSVTQSAAAYVIAGAIFAPAGFVVEPNQLTSQNYPVSGMSQAANRTATY